MIASPKRVSMSVLCCIFNIIGCMFYFCFSHWTPLCRLGFLPKLFLCCYCSAPNLPQPVLLCFLSRFSLTLARRWNDSLTVISAADTLRSPVRPLAEAAALSALGRGSGPFRAMFTEARHRPFVMVSMCVCKRACAWEKGGENNWEMVPS